MKKSRITTIRDILNTAWTRNIFFLYWHKNTQKVVLRRKENKRNQPVSEIYFCAPSCSQIKKNCWCQVGQISCELIGFSAKEFNSQEIFGHCYNVKILLYPTYSKLSKAYIRVRWGKVGKKGKSSMEKEETTRWLLEIIVGQECNSANPAYTLAFTRNEISLHPGYWTYKALSSLLPAFQLSYVAKTDLWEEK